MITSILFGIGAWFLSMIATILNALTWTIPSAFTDSITSYISYLGYAQGIVPVVATPGYTGLAGSIGLLTLFGYGLSFITLWYTVKLIIWMFALIPWIGKHVPMPHSGGHSSGEHK